MISWYVVSFDRRLSEPKTPPGSEKSTIICQNARSLSRFGSESAATSPRGPTSATPDRLNSAVTSTSTWRRRIIMDLGARPSDAERAPRAGSPYRLLGHTPGRLERAEQPVPDRGRDAVIDDVSMVMDAVMLFGSSPGRESRQVFFPMVLQVVEDGKVVVSEIDAGHQQCREP